MLFINIRILDAGVHKIKSFSVGVFYFVFEKSLVVCIINGDGDTYGGVHHLYHIRYKN